MNHREKKMHLFENNPAKIRNHGVKIGFNPARIQIFWFRNQNIISQNHNAGNVFKNGK
jgi:hypothetical protein